MPRQGIDDSGRPQSDACHMNASSRILLTTNFVSLRVCVQFSKTRPIIVNSSRNALCEAPKKTRCAHFESIEKSGDRNCTPNYGERGRSRFALFSSVAAVLLLLSFAFCARTRFTSINRFHISICLCNFLIHLSFVHGYRIITQLARLTCAYAVQSARTPPFIVPKR